MSLDWLDWLDWRNPIAIWWSFLVLVSVANIVLWRLLHLRFRQRALDRGSGIFRVELVLLLCAAYVFGCAFRSVLPRAIFRRSAFSTLGFAACWWVARSRRLRNHLRDPMGHCPAPVGGRGEIRAARNIST